MRWRAGWRSPIASWFASTGIQSKATSKVSRRPHFAEFFTAVKPFFPQIQEMTHYSVRFGQH